MKWAKVDKFTWEACVMREKYFVEAKWDGYESGSWFWTLYLYRDGEDDFDCGEWMVIATKHGFDDKESVFSAAEQFVSSGAFITFTIQEEEYA